MLAEKGELDQAWQIAEKHLTDVDPNDIRALMIATVTHEKAFHFAEAYQFAKRGVEVCPNKAKPWLNLGRIEEALYRFEEAEKAYVKCLSRIKPGETDNRVTALNNLSAMYVQKGDFVKGEKTARQALALNPEHRKANANLGLCLMAQGQWKEGWKLYDLIIGHGDQRKLQQYAGEPEWTGHKGRVVAIYGEQGLGDEISFASMIPDAIEDCSRVIIDCDHRLKGLFARSFPKATVYGTRWDSELKWKLEDQRPDASCAMGALGRHYRPAPESCPGTPYLVPDPDRVAMWKGLWAEKNKPVIGIAWSGGVQWTGAKFRRLSLEDLLPIFESVDAHWVCLQYKDVEAEIAPFRERYGVDIKQYPYATLTKDYDDTAGLVASLDWVVSMQTAVIHLAGGLGIPTFCFVHKHGQWRYGLQGTTIPWYKSVKLFRQAENGAWPIHEAAAELKARRRNGDH